MLFRVSNYHSSTRLIGFFLLFCMVATTTTQAQQQNQQRTALEKHVDFFDENEDGKISLGETAEGLEKIGVGTWSSYGLAVAINAGIVILTGGNLLDPTTIEIRKILQAKHDSDTDIYDEEGEFDTSRLNYILTTYGINNGTAIDEDGLERMHTELSETFLGEQASRQEWGLLMELAGEEIPLEDGNSVRVLTIDTLRSMFNGELFYILANEPVPF